MSPTPSDREARYRALCEVSRVLTSSLEPGEVLARITEHAAQLLEAEASLITALHGNVADPGAYLQVIATTASASIAPGQRLPLDGSLSGRALHERRTFVVNDVRADRRADQAVARAANVEQAVVTPLHSGDEPIGTIAVYNSSPRRPFDEEDGEILGVLGAQAAIALRNARRYEREQDQRQELERLKRDQERALQRLHGLVRAGMALNSQLSLEDVLQTLVEVARDVLRARYAALGVLDPTESALEHFVHSGIDEATAERIGPLPTGRGILGLIIREGRTLRLRDLSAHSASCGFPEGHPEMHSFLGVPIRIGDRAFGNLYLTEKADADEFSSEDEDIAELLAAQAAIAIEAATLNEQRSQFLAIVNHEIKNAAAGVVGWSERLASLTESAEPRVRQSAEYLFEGSRQLHRLVVDLLDLSRIETRRVRLDRREVDLAALVREVADALRPEAERRHIELRTVGVDRAAVTTTDPGRVRQILLNLLTNALKFSSAEGRVDLEIAPAVSRDGWAITVQDTGPGLEAEAGEEAFQSHRPPVRSIGGRGSSGLGLAISHQLARLLGGELSLEDRGPGARFRLHLPAQPDGSSFGGQP